jgi:hypothetical protein
MSIYDKWPEEIWLKILLSLNSRDIIQLCKTSKELNDLISKYNIKNVTKYRGYPRKTGHCASIAAHNFAYLFDDDIEDNFYENEKNRHIVLNHMYDKNYDLVRGDLIFFEGLDCDKNDGVYIFDGCKILELIRCWDDIPPSEFTVINDHVPIDYWDDGNNFRGLKNQGWHTFRWFDHNSVPTLKQKCVDGIEMYDAYEQIISTSFVYNNTNYELLNYLNNPEEFVKLLKDEHPLLLEIHYYHSGNRSIFVFGTIKDIGDGDGDGDGDEIIQ